MKMGFRHQTCAVLIASLISSAASAQTPEPADHASAPDDAAKTKFAAAVKLYTAAQPDQALILFRELVDATGSPNARLYVGLCLEQQGHIVQAYEELTRTAKDASLRPDAKYDRTREAALAEMAVLDARIGKLVLTVAETPADVAVSVDGRRLDEREVGVQIVLEPGTHHVEAAAPGRPPTVRDVRLDGGETRTVTLGFGDGRATRAGGDDAVSVSPLRVAGYAVAGAAVAGLAMFAVGGLLAQSKYDALQDACGTRPCSDERLQNQIDAGKSAETVANVGLAIGLGGAALSAALLVISMKRDSVPVAAEPRRGGGYVSYVTSF
jgi:hypothetical protein